MKKMIPQKLKNIYHLFWAILANFWFCFPSKKINVIGVTGTNGKTTTVQMIVKVLEAGGRKVAMASTINFQLGEKEWINTTKFTTLSAWQVQKFLSQAVKEKCQYAVLETSSHALDQNRVWGVRYKTAVITNITREHLDYHLSMEKYREAKKKLFEKAETAIVNLEMTEPKGFLSKNQTKVIGYAKNATAESFKGEKIVAENLQLSLQGSRFMIKGVPFQLSLIGEFNVENALAAISVGVAENIALVSISQALRSIQNVPGRLEFVENKRDLNILIDYAVTPDSLEKLYALIKKINERQGKIIAVLGACGDRDRGKRPIMGEIVSHYADIVILTDEDPYFEDPNQIISELKAGIPICHSEAAEGGSKNLINSLDDARDDNFCKIENVNLWIIRDREKAIEKALAISKSSDFVVVTGKGAEMTMAIGKKRIPWNDRAVIEKLLSSEKFA